MRQHEVVIAGGGPTGLMLAGELALAGVDVVVIERRPNQELAGSRAGGLLARTIEVLDQRGIADRFVSQGQKHLASMFREAAFSADLPTRHNYVLGLKQNHIERILAEWVAELRVPLLYGKEVTGFTQDDEGVVVALADGESVRARYLAGCDGGRSLIRKAAGIDFPGWDPSLSWLIAEVHTAVEPKWGFHEDALGTHAIGKAEGGLIGVVLTEREVRQGGEPTLRDVSEALIAVYGTDFGIHSPRWVSRFTDMTRQAAAYRAGRVLLAGDAAHIHPPIGGQGLNMGMQDAVNVGWKLAQVVHGSSPATLLDSYHAERHPVAARVLRTTMAQVALRRPDDRTKALRDTMTELLALQEPSRYVTAMMTGLDIHYPPGEGHPLLGRRVPDLDLATADGPRRVYTFMHDARPILLTFGDPLRLDVSRWADRVQSVVADYDGPWELPVVGTVTAPAAVLIRPDGHVAWVGDGSDSGLDEALTKWFGPRG